MPTYEYRCRKCKKKFDKLQSMTEPPLTRCIYCKGKVERLISAGAGLIFKGSGFYSTDYKKKSGPGKDEKKSDSPKTPAPPADVKKNPDTKKA